MLLKNILIESRLEVNMSEERIFVSHERQQFRKKDDNDDDAS